MLYALALQQGLDWIEHGLTTY